MSNITDTLKQEADAVLPSAAFDCTHAQRHTAPRTPLSRVVIGLFALRVRIGSCCAGLRRAFVISVPTYYTPKRVVGRWTYDCLEKTFKLWNAGQSYGFLGSIILFFRAALAIYRNPNGPLCKYCWLTQWGTTSLLSTVWILLYIGDTRA